MKKEKQWQLQNESLRNPAEIVGAPWESCAFHKTSLKFKADLAFIELLEKLKIGLFASREYENLVLHISAEKGKIKQSFLCLPHPSGIAIDESKKMLYLASSRNPNYILEMSFNNAFHARNDSKGETHAPTVLMPSRQKFIAGSNYLHDLAIINDTLYANSVGNNGILEIDFNTVQNPKIVWQANTSNAEDLSMSNYLQLNSIAAGKTLNESFFTASSELPQKYKPGSLDFIVDKQGVVFSAKTKDVVCRNLTRPHSARFFKNEIWLCNSGYGNIGRIENENYISKFDLPGWTRGLYFYKNYVFVGVSRVLPKFEKYAPGVNLKNQCCGIYAYDLEKNEFVGKIKFPNGNQIFAIEGIATDKCSGFTSLNSNFATKKEINTYYNYKIEINEHERI